MQAITITPKAIKKEIKYFATVFLFVFMLNIYAVYKYDSPWTEIITAWYIICFFTFVLYGILMVFRVMTKFIQRLWYKWRRHRI